MPTRVMRYDSNTSGPYAWLPTTSRAHRRWSG